MITRSVKVNAGALLAVIAVIAAAVPLVGHADEISSRQMPVSYAELDLSTADGASRLYGRIGRTDNYVCGTSDTDIKVLFGVLSPPEILSAERRMVRGS